MGGGWWCLRPILVFSLWTKTSTEDWGLGPSWTKQLQNLVILQVSGNLSIWYGHAVRLFCCGLILFTRLIMIRPQLFWSCFVVVTKLSQVPVHLGWVSYKINFDLPSLMSKLITWKVEEKKIPLVFMKLWLMWLWSQIEQDIVLKWSASVSLGRLWAFD